MLPEAHRQLAECYDRLFCAPDFGLDGRRIAGFGNLGYFAAGIDDLGAACEHLMDVLMARIERRRGTILDVACGLGGTTRCLTKIFPPAAIHGINISARQIEQCHAYVPGAHFHLMQAEHMSFPDEMFDVVISVEAAMHFKGRCEFLSEAMRVLKPGGEIVVADMPFYGEPSAFLRILGGQELYADLDAYRALWESAGIADIAIEDVSKPVWQGFCTHVQKAAFQDRLKGHIDAARFEQRLRFAAKMRALPALAYVIVKGRKPDKAG